MLGLSSRTTVGGEEQMRTVNALPGVQTEAQQDGPLEEVGARDPYGVNGFASFADDLSVHGFPPKRCTQHRKKMHVRHNMTIFSNQASAKLETSFSLCGAMALAACGQAVALCFGRSIVWICSRRSSAFDTG
jgi:hypothetical protein